MLKLLTATVLLMALRRTDAAGFDPEIAGNTVTAASPYYQRTFQVEPHSFLRVLGLDPVPLHAHFGGPFEYHESVGSGVSALEHQESFLGFSPVTRVQKAAHQFFIARGVELGTSPDRALYNHLFFNPESGTLYAQGTLQHLQLVAAVLERYQPTIKTP